MANEPVQFIPHNAQEHDNVVRTIVIGHTIDMQDLRGRLK